MTSFAAKEKWVSHVLYLSKLSRVGTELYSSICHWRHFALTGSKTGASQTINEFQPRSKVMFKVLLCFFLCSLCSTNLYFEVEQKHDFENESMIWKRNPKMLPFLKHQCLTTWTKRWRVPWFPLCSQIETAKQTDKWKQDKASHPAMKMFTIF